MAFTEYIETVLRIKQINVELIRYIEPEIVDDVETGEFITTDRGLVAGRFEGSSGKDVIIRKNVLTLLNATEKTALVNIMEKLELLANNAIGV